MFKTDDYASLKLKELAIENGFESLVNDKRLLYEINNWLRDEHKLHVSAFPVMNERFFYSIREFGDDGCNDIVKSPYDPNMAKKTYQDALSEGLYIAINYIKK